MLFISCSLPLLSYYTHRLESRKVKRFGFLSICVRLYLFRLSNTVFKFYKEKGIFLEAPEITEYYVQIINFGEDLIKRKRKSKQTLIFENWLCLCVVYGYQAGSALARLHCFTSGFTRFLLSLTFCEVCTHSDAW